MRGERTGPLSVLHCVGTLDPADGGPSRTVPALARAVGELGTVTSTIVTCSIASKPASRFEGIRVVAVPYRSRKLREVWGRPFRRVVSHEIQTTGALIVHDNGMWLQTNHAAVGAAVAARTPLIISPRGMLEPWSLGQGAWRKKAAWWMFQHRDLESATALHATSQLEADNLRRLGLRQPIAVIGNGAEAGPRRTSNPDGVPQTLLFLSRIHPKKGLLDLVAAWKVARPHAWRVVIAGPDEDGHRATVEAAIQREGLAGEFEFMGAVDGERKVQLFQRASLFVLPTYSENFGVVVAEALAHGVPVITTTAAPWGALQDERCGWWIQPGATSLAAVLRQATAMTPEALWEMGERGRTYVSREHSWARVGEQMRQFYDWVIVDGATTPGFVMES